MYLFSYMQLLFHHMTLYMYCIDFLKQSFHSIYGIVSKANFRVEQLIMITTFQTHSTKLCSSGHLFYLILIDAIECLIIVNTL